MNQQTMTPEQLLMVSMMQNILKEENLSVESFPSQPLAPCILTSCYQYQIPTAGIMNGDNISGQHGISHHIFWPTWYVSKPGEWPKRAPGTAV